MKRRTYRVRSRSELLTDGLECVRLTTLSTMDCPFPREKAGRNLQLPRPRMNGLVSKCGCTETVHQQEGSMNDRYVSGAGD